MQEEIVYLGFLISADGLKMGLEKFKVILECLVPENVGKVRSFHGLASFYMKFVKNINVSYNAMNLNRRGDKNNFKWTHGANKSFEALKQKVVELLVLALPNFNKVFQV